MNDWNEYREQLTLRLREFSKLAPETTKGIASLVYRDINNAT
jgi:hypothetical protein